MSFKETKESFQTLVQQSLEDGDYSGLEDKWKSLSWDSQDKRSILDATLRELILESSSLEFIKQLVSYSIKLCQSELASPATPVLILSDFFDISTLDACEHLFSYVEAHVPIWKDDIFFSSCKNHILRMCNDLLRRLSRSQNTVFRGRILLFLASFFPFSERSGLNVVSEFNLENSERVVEADEAMDLDGEASDEKAVETGEKKIKVDHNLFYKFLTLQEFFRNPTLCYNKMRWRDFALSWTDTFKTFEDYKLDARKLPIKSVRQHLDEAATGHVFFAKYLTNPRLLQLQLSDPVFRRSLIIQGLVTLQYLNTPVKFKQEGFELRPVQQEWVRDQEGKLYTLLAETPAGSNNFRDMVKHILNRELLWNNWKNEGCPEFKKPGGVEEEEVTKPRGPIRRRNVGRLIREATVAGKFYMGNPNLTRLWNVSPNNLEACKANSRNFLPTLDEYLKEAMEQTDPSACVEPQYRLVADPNFAWRALRLLAHRAPCFFANSNSSIAKIPEFIEASMKKVLKERPAAACPAEEVIIKEDVEMEQDGDTDAEPEVNNTVASVASIGEIGTNARKGDEPLPEVAAERVAELLSEEQWRKLAVKLGFTAEDGQTAAEGLKQWAKEDEDATADNLFYVLEGLGLGYESALAVLREGWCTPG